MNEIGVLLFDVDGTILDTREFILRAAEHSLSINGFQVPDRSVISKLVGSSFDHFYATLTGSADRAVLDRLQKAHGDFQKSNFNLSVPFPGAIETLGILRDRGFKMAAVTSRRRETSLETLEQAGFMEFFTTVISAEDAPAQKPDPSPLLKALEELKESADAAVMIGDSDLDVQAGKNAGSRTVRAMYGFHRENLHQPEPDMFIDDIADLLGIFGQD